MAKAKKRRRRNVQMGFYDARGFHPIRASRDYDSGRLEDDTEGSYRRRSKKKAKSKGRKKNPSHSRTMLFRTKADAQRYVKTHRNPRVRYSIRKLKFKR